MLAEYSGLSIALFVTAPFVFWGVFTLGFVLNRRRKVTVGAGRTGDLIGSDVPNARPLSSLSGGAWIGGMGVSYPLAILELHPEALVLRSKQGVFTPVVVNRKSIGRLKISRGLLGVSLHLFDSSGRQIDVSFRAFGSAGLRRALSAGGWIGLLTADQDKLI